MDAKTGVLLVNLGTPDAPTRGAVYRYLKEFLLDGRVIDYPWLPRNLLVRGIIAPFRSGSSAKLYQRLWTEDGSPLKIYGEKITGIIANDLGDDFVVRLAMRYQTPSIKAGLLELKKHNVNQIIILPLFPQYASATTGSVHQEVMRIVSKWQSIPELSFINSYPMNDKIISAFADNALKYNMEDYDHIVFSFHGVPQRQLHKADDNAVCLRDDCCKTLTTQNQFCYSAQCHSTAYKIADKLNLTKDQFTVCFQSRLGFEDWTQPYTSVVLDELVEAGKKNVLVFSPAFVADCLETTIEIGYEYKEEFEEKGGEKLDLVESLNDNALWIEAIKSMILTRKLEVLQ